MRLISGLFLLMLCHCGYAVAGVAMECEYQFAATKPSTTLAFTLPDEVGFGKLVPIQIKTKTGGESAMNTVILKDYPYIVLADVYRIETEKSKVFLMKITPDKTKIELAFVNMGDQANAKFFKGTCITRKVSK